MTTETVLIELAFFVFGILPWWYIAYMKNKTLPYWVLYLFVCLVWLPYYTFVHFAPMGLLNNVVESGIAVYGLYRITRRTTLEKQ